MAAALQPPPPPAPSNLSLTESTAVHLALLARHYQLVLARKPGDPHALVAMTMVALAGRQPEAALRMAELAIAAAPAMSAAWIALGQARRANQQFEPAEQAFIDALRIDPNSPLAVLGLAELSLAAEEPELAIDRYSLALRHHPGLVPALLGMGHALGCQRHFDQALLWYENVLAFRPDLAEAHFAAAFALARLNRVAEAETRYLRALTLRPDFAPAWMNLGCLLREQGRPLHAEAAIRRALRLRPDLVSAWVNRALLARDAGHLAEAESHLRRAFALNQAQPETLLAWARLRLAQRDFAGAHAWLRWALHHAPLDCEAHNTLGILLHTESRFAEAVPAFVRAESLGSFPAISNRGNSLLDLGRMQEALDAHQAAVDRDPAHPGARYNLALTQLRLGFWRQGWRNYEARWQFREVHRRPRVFPQPRWQGQPLSGQRVLLHAEQGLGDTIQFCRFAALVAARGGRPILQVQAPVARLLRSLAVVRAGLAEIALLDDPPPLCDLECPLMSLPAVFATTPETVPWPGLYLAPDSSLSVPCSSPPCLSVGIAWSGNPRYKSDHLRSTRLEALLPLLATPGFHWVSLQKGAAAGQLAGLPPGIAITDAASADRDLADAASTISRLDAVVTTDTSIAHLAGAMAKPVFLLLPHLADWRWMQETSSTPWYPTFRLLRQPAPGDWSAVLDAARAALIALLNPSPRPTHAANTA